MEIGKLKPNERNLKYFIQEENAETKNLVADIKKRGILVPLVAKRDGTLLAGHRRLLCAKKLKFPAVPVQFVAEDLTEEQEIEYIIKDNLLRRHLSAPERRQLYRKLYPDIDEQILNDPRSGLGISAREVAEKTGLNQTTVGYDLNQMKHKRKREVAKLVEIDVKNDREIDRYKKSISKMLNVAIVEKGSTVNEFIELTEIARTRLQGISENIRSVS